jgi:hypothetical protein
MKYVAEKALSKLTKPVRKEAACFKIFHVQPTNQPKGKGGVLRERKTSSLARLDYSCVRKALPEVINGALCTVTADKLTCLR